MDTGQSEDAPLEVQNFGKEVDDSHNIMPSNCNWADDIIETDGDEKKVNYFHLSELLLLNNPVQTMSLDFQNSSLLPYSSHNTSNTGVTSAFSINESIFQVQSPGSPTQMDMLLSCEESGQRVTPVQKRKSPSPLAGRAKIPCQGLALLRISDMMDEFQLGPSPFLNNSQTLIQNLRGIIDDISSGKLCCTQKQALRSIVVHLHTSWPVDFSNVLLPMPQPTQPLDVAIYCYVLFVSQKLKSLNNQVQELISDLMLERSKTVISSQDVAFIDVQSKEIVRLRQQCSDLTEKYSKSTRCLSESVAKQRASFRKEMSMMEERIEEDSKQISSLMETNAVLQRSLADFSSVSKPVLLNKDIQTIEIGSKTEDLDKMIKHQNKEIEDLQTVVLAQKKDLMEKKDNLLKGEIEENNLKRTQIKLESSTLALSQAQEKISNLQLQLMEARADAAAKIVELNHEHAGEVQRLKEELKTLRLNQMKKLNTGLKAKETKEASQGSSSDEKVSENGSTSYHSSDAESEEKSGGFKTPPQSLSPADQLNKEVQDDQVDEKGEKSKEGGRLTGSQESSQTVTISTSSEESWIDGDPKSQIMSSHSPKPGGPSPIDSNKLKPFSSTNKLKEFEDQQEKEELDFEIEDNERNFDDAEEEENVKQESQKEKFDDFQIQKSRRSKSKFRDEEGARASKRDVEEGRRRRRDGDEVYRRREDSRRREEYVSSSRSGRYSRERSEYRRERRYSAEDSVAHKDFIKIRSMTNKVKLLIASDPRLTSMLKNEEMAEGEMWNLINSKLLKNLAMCETAHDFERFISTKKGPDRMVCFSQWPDFSSQSREWRFVVINDKDKPRKGCKIPPFVNFDNLITLIRIYNVEFYDMFVTLLKNSKPGGTHYTDLLFPKVFDLDTEVPRSLYEKKVDLLQLILVARLHFAMKKKQVPVSRNRRGEFNFRSQPFTRDWAREIGEASQLDNLFLNESDINSLYVQSRNCFLAVNQFKHEKTPRGEDWDDRESGEGSSFLDNSD